MDPHIGRAKAGQPAWTYIQQLCEDTGCSSGDQPEAMNDGEKWRDRVKDIPASSTTWWYIYIMQTKKGYKISKFDTLKFRSLTFHMNRIIAKMKREKIWLINQKHAVKDFSMEWCLFTWCAQEKRYSLF